MNDIHLQKKKVENIMMNAKKPMRVPEHVTKKIRRDFGA